MKYLFPVFLFMLLSFSTEEKKQCIGITTKGVQCKRMLLKSNPSNYCYQHSKETDLKNKKK